MTRKSLEQTQSRHGCRFNAKQPLAVRTDEIEQFARRGDGFIGDRGYAIEKEIDPALPVAFQPHEVEASIIFVTVALEKQAEIEERSLEEAPVFQQEGDHEASDSPIPVEIGLNGRI